MRAKHERSVANLVNLYTVVIGVALSMAVAKLFGDGASLEALTLPAVLLFVAFIATLFPFYQGALQHLDDSYIDSSGRNVRSALMIDFVLLFIHALVFVILALLTPSPIDFAWVLVGLLSIDVMWGFFAYFASSSKASTNKAEMRWSVINLVTVIVLVCYIVLGNASQESTDDPLKVAVVIVSICVLRTMTDYLLCRDFYFR